jgi:hypothetical protein
LLAASFPLIDHPLRHCWHRLGNLLSNFRRKHRKAFHLPCNRITHQRAHHNDHHQFSRLVS